jgi:cephalosporin hydroxylase
MRLTIDTDSKSLLVETPDGETENYGLYSKKAFELLSQQWLKVGWNQKHVYTFSWLGRPIIQLPEDVLRAQEVIYQIKPDVLIETGVAHGGSLILYASLFKAMGRGRVVGVDIEIRPHNRTAIESHEMASFITLIEGSSTAPETLNKVQEQIRPGDRVMIILDSNHTRSHVLQELEIYAPLVSKGSYIVATDGSMEDLHDVPRGSEGWRDDNPAAAAREFAVSNKEFEIVQPPWLFNESELSQNITHWPDSWLIRR